MPHPNPLRRLVRRPLAALAVAAVALALVAAALAPTAAPAATPDSERRLTTPAVDGFAKRVARVDGRLVAFYEGGRGRPLLLLHGWPQTAYEFHAIMPRLARSFRVIVPDLPGAGGSSAPASFRKEAVAGDLVRFLRAVDAAPALVAGHDIGGMIAYAMAASAPEAVRRVAILDVPLPGIGPWTQVEQDPRSWHFTFNDQRGLAEALTRGRERVFLRTFIRDFAFSDASFRRAFPPRVLDVFVRQYQRPGRMRQGFGWYRAFDRDEADNRRLSRRPLAMPVLGVGGEAASAPLLGPTLTAVAPAPRVEVLPRAGHWLAEEQPAALTARLLAFFGAQR